MTCDHRHRVAYTDEGGLYSRCQVCRAEFLDGAPLRGAQPPILEPCDLCHGRLIIAIAGPDEFGNYDTDDCPCQDPDGLMADAELELLRDDTLTDGEIDGIVGLAAVYGADLADLIADRTRDRMGDYSDGSPGLPW